MSDLEVKRGDTIELTVGPILKADGTVQNITGYAVQFTAKDRITDLDGAAVLAQAGTIVNGPGGIAQVVVARGQTEGFTADRVLWWDVQIREPVSGITKTIDSGKLRVVRDVTRG